MQEGLDQARRAQKGVGSAGGEVPFLAWRTLGWGSVVWLSLAVRTWLVGVGRVGKGVRGDEGGGSRRTGLR